MPNLQQTCLPLQFFMCTLAVKNVYNHKNHVYNQHREKTEMLITQRNKTKSTTENVAYTNAILVFTHHFLDCFFSHFTSGSESMHSSGLSVPPLSCSARSVHWCSSAPAGSRACHSTRHFVEGFCSSSQENTLSQY